MTDADAPQAENAHDHSPGGAVVASGPMSDGEAAVAVWHVDEAGRSTGAWIIPQSRAYGDRDAARGLLTRLERRAVTAVDPDVVAEVLGKLTVAAQADLPMDWWDARTFTAVGAVADVVRRREQFDDTVLARRESGRSAARLRWTRRVDAQRLPREHEDARVMAGVGTVGDSEAAAEVLTVVNVLRWVVDLWSETERAKNRRRYVLDAHGPVEVLPPSWAAARARASEGRFPW